jgi:hypothetical protein
MLKGTKSLDRFTKLVNEWIIELTDIKNKNRLDPTDKAKLEQMVLDLQRLLAVMYETKDKCRLKELVFEALELAGRIWRLFRG